MLKKKSFYVLFLLTSFIVSCGGSEESKTDEPVEEKGHTISGTIDNAEGQKVRLMVFESGKQTFIDSTFVKEGKYSVKTFTKELRQYVLFVGEDSPVILFLDENSKDVNVSGSVPEFGKNYSVTGSEHSEGVRNYMLFLMQYYDREMELINKVNSINPEDKKQIDPLMASLDSISQIQKEYAIKEILKDSTSPVSWMLLGEMIPARGLAGFDTSDIKYYYMVANGMRSKYPYSEYPNYIDQDIQTIMSQFAAPSSGVEIGSVAPEINLTDTKGKPLALSSLRGNVVLIDFWASWCMPCRAENPNVVKVYDKYKDKGFTVYSVSLDEDKDAWLQAIQSDNLKWPNHVSDLRGWQSSAAATYNVRGIPQTFLLDEEGVIIATNLRGEQLEQKLKEVLD